MLLCMVYSSLLSNSKEDTLCTKNTYSRFSIDLRPGYILKTNSFVDGDNFAQEPLNSVFSAHFKYAFGYNVNSIKGKIYNGVYQGIGGSFFNYGDKIEIGTPYAFYIFQGAKIASLTDFLSLNYEWNLGLSFGWKTYDEDFNFYNKVMGSTVNAYIDFNLYFLWRVYKNFHISTGANFTHFSDGNTKLPNAGMNSVSFNMGLIYSMQRGKSNLYRDYDPRKSYFNYDLTLFGWWRRRVSNFQGEDLAFPDKYFVGGISVAAMYNVGYKFRVGAALEGTYDSSANIQIVENATGESRLALREPPYYYKMALGISARFEFVMPIFTVGAGIGTNFLGVRDMKSVYQLLYLKAYYVKRSYIHVGYSLHNFDTPNYLMIGVGFTFGKPNTVL